jgi:hypothetical protein
MAAPAIAVTGTAATPPAPVVIEKIVEKPVEKIVTVTKEIIVRDEMPQNITHEEAVIWLAITEKRRQEGTRLRRDGDSWGH